MVKKEGAQAAERETKNAGITYKIGCKTIKGMDFTIRSERSEVSPDVQVRVSATVLGTKVDTEIFRHISEYQGHPGIHAGYVKENKIFLAVNEDEEQKIEDFFGLVQEEEEDRRAHWMEINLGVCFHTDYSSHWWRGDDRTPLEQIIKEGSAMLTCCHKEETTEESVRKAYDSFMQRREERKTRQEKRENKEQAAFARAKESGQKQKIRGYSVECDDPHEECDLDIVTEWAMPDGSVKTTRHHTW